MSIKKRNILAACLVILLTGCATTHRDPLDWAVNRFLLDVWLPSQNDPWSCSGNAGFLWLLLYGEPMEPIERKPPDRDCIVGPPDPNLAWFECDQCGAATDSITICSRCKEGRCCTCSGNGWDRCSCELGPAAGL